MAAALVFPDRHHFPALVGSPASAPARQHPDRAVIYRRRRIVAALGALVALWVLLSVASWSVSAVRDVAANVTDRSAPPAAAVAGETGTRVHTVRAGDSLWSIAQTVHPDGDIRPIVDELARRTGGQPLRPGQRIDVDGLD